MVSVVPVVPVFPVVPAVPVVPVVPVVSSVPAASDGADGVIVPVPKILSVPKDTPSMVNGSYGFSPVSYTHLTLPTILLV